MHTPALPRQFDRPLPRAIAAPRPRAGGLRGGALRGLVGLIVPVALVALWQWIVERGIYSESQLPPPLEVVAAARELAREGDLWGNVRISLIRVGWGFAGGAGVALGLGLIVGLSRFADALLSPTIQALRAIPSLAWVPLLLLWMGIDEAPKLTLIGIGAFFPIYTNLVSGIRQIDRKLIEVGRAYGLRGPRLALGVMLPAALPSLFTGLRLGLAQGWLFLVAAELLGSSAGLGFLLIEGSGSYRSDIIVLTIILLALIGKTSDFVLHLVERRLLRWTDGAHAGS